MATDSMVVDPPANLSPDPQAVASNAAPRRDSPNEELPSPCHEVIPVGDIARPLALRGPDLSRVRYLHRLALRALYPHREPDGENQSGPAMSSSIERSQRGDLETDMESTPIIPKVTLFLPHLSMVAAVVLYKREITTTGSDVWPDVRDPSKAPLRYVPLQGLEFHKERATRAKTKVVVTNPYQVVVWPANKIPSELYTQIISHLSRDDVKAMRLACKEFEKHVSHALFSTVVVPFNTEIFGMLVHDGNVRARAPPSVSGNKQIGVTDLPNFWKNSHSEDIYTGHGLQVYQGFGPHIRRYGMSFEVDEALLARPPNKNSQELHQSYWGFFPWPYQQYKRFERTANLESIADETPKMKQAFSCLTQVKELALSIDSGLGWLNGPDWSIRNQVLSTAAPVFRVTHAIPDRNARAQQSFWDYLKSQFDGDSKCACYRLQHLALDFQDSDFEEAVKAWQVQNGTEPMWLDSYLVSELKMARQASVVAPDADCPGEAVSDGLVNNAARSPVAESKGMIYFTQRDEDASILKPGLIVPNALTNPQKEWLLETEWAQRAFLSSYMISVIDNPVTFKNVHALNLARISSRYINQLNRVDFWQALPNLRNVTVKVIADWRDVTKDPAGFVDTPMIAPSSALKQFHGLLQDTIAKLENIKTLALGWASGGEHAKGMHARNKHLLPAPFVFPGSLEDGMNATQTEDNLIIFTYVEHLTLHNAWITPDGLENFIMVHANLRIKKLSLVSVSLTPVERVRDAVIQPQPQQNQVIPPHLAARLAGVIQNLQSWAQGYPFNWTIYGNSPTAGQQMPAFTLPQLLHQITQMQAFAVFRPIQHHIPLLLNPQSQGERVIADAWNNAEQAQANTGLPFWIGDWRSPPRRGSWPWILDKFSPGKNLSDFGLEHSRADAVRTTASALVEFELVSCGYAKVISPRFDNGHVVGPSEPDTQEWFKKRREALSPYMMMTMDVYLGEIVRYIPYAESTCLRNVWDIHGGWHDGDASEAALFDGVRYAGNERMNGAMRRSDRDELNMVLE